MEEKKLIALLRDTFHTLTDDQKEKVRACKDLNELTALLGEMGVELPDELLDAVAGGVIYRVYEHIYRNGQEKIGKVLGYIVANDKDNDDAVEVTSEDDAKRVAAQFGWDGTIIDS